MKNRIIAIVILLTFTIIISLFLIQPLISSNQETEAEVYFGIDVAYDDSETIFALIDKVSPYTNFFIVGCTGISLNVTKLNTVCQYLYDKELSFIIYQDSPLGIYDSSNWSFNSTRPQNSSNAPFPRSSLNPTTTYQRSNSSQSYNYSLNAAFVSNWTTTAKNKWGENFLGFYYIDEPAGRQLDHDPEWTVVKNATDYADASNQFNHAVSNSVNWYRSGYSNWTNLSLFTSDYALYQFDYEAGFDVLLAQLGWNYSRQLNIALCRGAATLQNKDWGVIITWEYTEPPYLESGEDLYNDLVLAYTNGAKYIVIFDSNENYTASTLTEEHFDALKQFWQYVKDNPRKISSASDRVAYVLPEDYGYGFRGPNDSIWGLWAADPLSENITVSLSNKLLQYGDKIDIVYNESQLQACGYKELIFWH